MKIYRLWKILVAIAVVMDIAVIVMLLQMNPDIGAATICVDPGRAVFLVFLVFVVGIILFVRKHIRELKREAFRAPGQEAVHSE